MEKLLQNNKILMISHVGDPDGIGSLILAKLAFKKIDYLLIDTKDEAKMLEFIKNSKYEQIYICDIPMLDYIGDEISKLNINIKHFDHHGTNMYVSKYSFSNVSVSLNDRLTCGTELFYNYLTTNKLLNKTKLLDEFVEDIRSYDVWDWRKDNNMDASDINTLFDFIGPVNFYKTFIKSLPKMHDFKFTKEQKRIIDIENKKQEEFINSINEKLIKVKIDNLNVGITFTDRYKSILGNELCLRNTDIDYVMIINMINFSVSLRSIETDVSKIAQTYGGGGHIHASGFPLTKDSLNKILKTIITYDI